MILNFDYEPSQGLPAEANFWLPTPDELAEAEGTGEGFGYFRDTWLIYEVPRNFAMDVIMYERRAIDLIDATAHTAEEFEDLAHYIEGDMEDDEPTELTSRASWALRRGKLSPHGETANLDGLELGVAGLALAFSVTGMMPVASCRGHSGDRSWSDAPVLFFGARKNDAERVADLANELGCGLEPGDSGRSELLVVAASNIRKFNLLASRMLTELAS